MGTMNKKDWDAAFPETPDVVRHAVYSAFREGKKRDRRRRHFTQAAAIAATLVVMLGLGMLMRQAGLGAKRNVLTQNDSLPQVSASAQPGEAGTTALPTQSATPEPTAVPTAAPTARPTETTETVSPEPTVSVTTLPPEMENGSAAGMPESSVIYDDGETVYYPNLSGVQYYHASEEEAKKSLSEADADCEILSISRSQADSIGLWACPDCLFDPGLVYLADGGQTYHRDPHCGDLQGTHGCSLYEAMMRGLSACEKCAAVDEVFISPYQPTFYHGSTLCSSFASKGTEEFDTLAEDQALYSGMLPCAECLGASYSVLTASDWQRVVASGSVCVYYSGNRYHLDKACAPENSQWLLLGKAMCSDLVPCVDCVQIYETGFISAISIERAQREAGDFYFTEGGTYYHTEPNCSGMRNAISHTLTLALASGKKPCPVCYPYDPTSQDSVTRYAMSVFRGCFGAEYPFERNVDEEQTSADAGNGQGFCEFCYATPSTELSDQTDGAYVNVYDHEVTLSMSLWDAKRMQSFIEQWKNTDLTSAYEQVFTQVSAGSNTTCRLYAVDLTATLDASRYVPTLDDCTFYFLMTNPSTNFRAAVEVIYSIANQRLTAMNWQYE